MLSATRWPRSATGGAAGMEMVRVAWVWACVRGLTFYLVVGRPAWRKRGGARWENEFFFSLLSGGLLPAPFTHKASRVE